MLRVVGRGWITVSRQRQQWMNQPHRVKFTSSLHGSHGTYYDSQSGQHVPLIDESQVTAYLRLSRDTHGGMAEQIKYATTWGMAGIITTMLSLEDVSEFAASWKERTFALFIQLPTLSTTTHLRSIPSNMNLCFEYTDNASHLFHGSSRRTSIFISDPNYYRYRDPISVASGVANLMDTAAASERSLISYILLDPPMAEDPQYCQDEMVRLCEELSYLDVTGPTVKSRLIVSAQHRNSIEECLHIGVSKFIVEDIHSLEELGEAVKEAGKTLILK